MKRILAGLTLVAVARLMAEDIAVFARNEIVVGIDQASGVIPSDPTKRIFLKNFRADRQAKQPFEAALPLINPPEWGKTVSAMTRGGVKYHKAFDGGLVCDLALLGLLPNHHYILTLNGNPEKEGNALLPDLVPGMEKERYYDFLSIETDARGRYESTFGIYLKPSLYEVRIYVKDSDDFKIVLYRDFFRFEAR